MLRVCVIGMGHIGNLHADIHRSNPGAELVGVCDILPDRAARAAARHDVPAFADAAEMLAQLKPDVCSITTGGFEYSSDHYLPTMQAIAAGCHVLCEKPICNDIALAAEMVQAAHDANRCFGIDFNHRFTPAAYAAKKWQNQGLLGELLFVNVALWIGRPGGFDSPNYHMKALNPHSIDLIRHFCGDITEVHCFAMQAEGRNFWSTASFNFKLANGMVGHLTSSYDIERGHPMERVEVAGVKGRLLIEDMWREATLFPAGQGIKQVYTNPVFGGYRDFDDTFRARINRFVEQVDQGAKPEEIDGSGADGLAAQRVIAAAIQSLNTGAVVRVEDV